MTRHVAASSGDTAGRHGVGAGPWRCRVARVRSAAGREQAGRRPAVVLSPASYNAPTGRALCVPVTTKAKGYPFEVALPADCPVQGVAFADRVTCLDWRARHAQHAAVLPAAVVAQVLARTRALLE